MCNQVLNNLPLRDLISFSRDGEWGNSDPLPGATRMRVIRGTDFDSVRTGDLSAVPERWIDSVQADRKRLEPDDILIESAGGSRDQITGRTLLVKESAIAGMPTTCASFSRIIRVDRTKILPQYLYWFLQNDHRNGDMHLTCNTPACRGSSSRSMLGGLWCRFRRPPFRTV